MRPLGQEGLLRAEFGVGAAVASATEALEALRTARVAGRPFPLVLTDLHMPDVDGFTLVESIRADPRLKGATIMLLTSGAGRSATASSSPARQHSPRVVRPGAA